MENDKILKILFQILQIKFKVKKNIIQFHEKKIIYKNLFETFNFKKIIDFSFNLCKISNLDLIKKMTLKS